LESQISLAALIKPVDSQTNSQGCCTLALPTEWITFSKVSKSLVSLRNVQLQNSYQLDSWWMFCPGTSFWIP